MSAEDVIIVKDLEKNFKVYFDKGFSLKEKVITKGRNRYENRRVLKGISFNVKKGEAIGLIGRNGCGKSTTLKLLTKIIYPDKGSIIIHGRVSSLLELGAGFHPDMSGRENIYLNAAIFGLTKREIDSRVQEIIHFSELEEFIDNPVRTYSSGMYMRLAFSVAINVDAEILLIDEILGVGDVSFQKKCFERLHQIKAAGTTIVIVSHSLEQIESICDRCIWIDNGVIVEEGTPVVVNARYYQQMEAERLGRYQESAKEHSVESKNRVLDNSTIPETKVNNIVNPLPAFCDNNAIRSGSQKGVFTSLKILDKAGNECLVFNKDDSIIVELKFKAFEQINDANISVSITRQDGVYCYGTNTKFDKYDDLVIGSNEQTLFFELNNIKLLSNKYGLNIGLYDKKNIEYDVIWNAKMFYVKDNFANGEIGIFSMEHLWHIAK